MSRGDPAISRREISDLCSPFLAACGTRRDCTPPASYIMVDLLPEFVIFLRFSRFSSSNQTLQESFEVKGYHVVTSCPEISTAPLPSFRTFTNSPPHVVPGGAAPDSQRVVDSTVTLSHLNLTPRRLALGTPSQAAASSADLFACKACTVHVHKWEPSNRPEASEHVGTAI